MESNLCGFPMQIGINFRDSCPENGGAHTYLAELLSAFAEMAHTSEHQFIILCNPAAVNTIELMFDAPNVKVVAVSKPSLRSRLLKPLKFFPPSFRFAYRYYGPVELEARRYKVQLLWFIGSVVYDCPDIPFISTMLDLQHRYQPFFPEVSAMGEYDAREHFFCSALRRATYCVTGTQAGKREIEYLYQVAEPRIRVLPLPTPQFALNALPSTIDVHKRFGIKDKYIFIQHNFGRTKIIRL